MCLSCRGPHLGALGVASVGCAVRTMPLQQRQRVWGLSACRPPAPTLPRPSVFHARLREDTVPHREQLPGPAVHTLSYNTQVRANHVFLLEPSLDPAIEQQAVARVHRIGQTRDVTVTRLLVDGTVEGAVMRMLKVCIKWVWCGLRVRMAGRDGAGDNFFTGCPWLRLVPHVPLCPTNRTLDFSYYRA